MRKPDFLKSEEELQKEKDAKLKLSEKPILEKSINSFEKDFTIRVKEDGTVIIKDSTTLLKLTPESKGEIVIESSEGTTKITVEKTK